MSRNELETSRDEIQQALDTARAFQTEFWNAMGDLESVLGCADIDSTNDLEGVTVDDLLDQYADDAEDEQ